MAPRRIEFAQSAQDDLLDILAWYSSQQVPDVGGGWLRPSSSEWNS